MNASAGTVNETLLIDDWFIETTRNTRSQEGCLRPLLAWGTTERGQAPFPTCEVLTGSMTNGK
jgi:hypothetical protein